MGSEALRGLTAPAGEHTVLLYDTKTFLADSVVDVLAAALETGGLAILVATGEHLDAFAAALETHGIDAASLRAAGRLVEVDATTALSTIHPDGELDLEAFRALATGLLDRAHATGRPVTVYGELVALLCSEGDVAGALKLEGAWHDLHRSRSFGLLCGYPVGVGHRPLRDQELAEIRARHTRVVAERDARDTGADSLLPQQVLFDSLPVSAAILDADGRILLVNSRWERFARDNGGHDVGVGTNYFAACEAAADEDETAAEALAGLRGLLAGTRSELSLLYPCHSPEEQRWFRLEAEPLDIAGATHLMVRHPDVTEHLLMQQDVHLRSRMLDEVDAAVIATDLAGMVTLWNRGAERLYGWSAAEATGTHIIELTVPPDLAEAAAEATDVLMETGAWEGRVEAVRKGGATIPVYLRSRLVYDMDGDALGVTGVSVDLTEQEALHHQVAHSSQQLRAVTQSIGEGLCTLDVHGRITYVNPAGEQLLATSLVTAHGTRLRDWLTSDADVTGPDDGPDHGGLTPSLHPVECDVLRGDGTRLPLEYVVHELQANDNGRPAGWIVVFRDISERRARERELRAQAELADWFERITDALAHNRFELHAQPIVDLATEEVVQHEVLIRLRDRDDPDRLISPGAFLPAAEELGLATAIDRWVVRHALELSDGVHPVEINLSAHSIGDASIIRYIEQQLEDTGADPTAVVFEITETALLENDEEARRFAHRVHELGCQLALDDFGTGYSSFTYLKQLPVDFLKIDMEFVRDAVTNESSRHVINAVVALARAFGIQTVAEGVEDPDTLVLLKALEVDFAQGYHLGRPRPTDTLPAFAAEELA